MDQTQQTLFSGFHSQEISKEALNLPPIHIKPGVVFKALKQEIWAIFPLISKVFARFGHDCVITSANDGTHKPNSRHYIDLAIDLRSHHLLDMIQKNGVLKELQDILGDKYLILFENPKQDNEHFHIGYHG